MKKYLVCISLALVCLSSVRARDHPQTQTATPSSGDPFKLTSSTFANNTTLPVSTIHNMIVNNVNVCSINGSPGGNQSPELSWSGAPQGTRTFVVVAYDVTAAFTHWGMYNISGTMTGVPANAGVAGKPVREANLQRLFYRRGVRRSLPSSACRTGCASLHFHRLRARHRATLAEFAEFPHQRRAAVSGAYRSGTEPPHSGKRKPDRVILDHAASACGIEGC